MIKNPYLNALLASAYIVGIVSLINIFAQVGHDNKDNILIPMTMLSLFVLSACVMGFLFAFTPIQMYLDGAKKEAIGFFLRTLATFAGLTAFFVITLFLTFV